MKRHNSQQGQTLKHDMMTRPQAYTLGMDDGHCTIACMNNASIYAVRGASDTTGRHIHVVDMCNNLANFYECV